MSISLGGIVNTTPRRQSFDYPKTGATTASIRVPRTVLVNASFLDGAAVDGLDAMMSFFGDFAEVTKNIW